MMRWLVQAFALVMVVGLVLACGEEGNVVTPPSFERPGALSFACFDTQARTFVALDSCPDSRPDEAADAALHLIAFVVQTSRGQIATVDVAARTVLDGDRRVPGFTFERTGEVPVAILTPADDPSFTYVASYGDRSLSAIPTHRLHPDAADSGLEPQTLVLEGPPTDLARSPDGSFLYISVTDTGRLFEVPIEAGVMGTPREVALQTAATTATAPDATAREFKSCADGVTLNEIAAEVPTPSVIDGEPAPAGLYVDGEGARLFVADARLPLIHVVSLSPSGAQVTTAPYDVGVPTERVVVTPPVPSGLLESSASDPLQFGYAIDAHDGSVLAFDATPGSPSEGAVLPTNDPTQVVDRLALSGGARVLAVLTPGYPGSSCDSAEAAPNVLRGVFLAVGMNDGAMRIVDVHDLDAPCRGGDPSPGSATGCGASPIAEDANIFIRRHRPRIGAFTTSLVAVQGSPALSVNASAQPVLSDGATDRDGYPSLVPFDGACPEQRVAAFPNDGELAPLICTLSDPWANAAQQWLATWEGRIPDTEQLVGRLSGSGAIVGAARFCDLGVLGADAAAPLPDVYVGDMVVLTSDPDEEGAACAAFATDAMGVRPRVAFAIASARQDELTLGEALGAYTIADVRGCFPGAFAFEVRVRGSFTVQGAVTGMRHATVADSGGACVLDVTRAEERQGRAFPDQAFDNGFVAFTISDFDPDSPPEEGAFSGLNFSIGNLPATLALDVGSIPAALKYLSADQRLYSVDASRRGLFQIDLNPVEGIRSYQ